MSDKAEKFVNDKLGDKNYTHSPYPIHREELVQWLDEFTNQWHEEFDLFKENQRLKENIELMKKEIANYEAFIDDRALWEELDTFTDSNPAN